LVHSISDNPGLELTEETRARLQKGRRAFEETYAGLPAHLAARVRILIQRASAKEAHSTPDRWDWVDGRPLATEFKSGKAKLSTAQRARLELLALLGLPCVVTRIDYEPTPEVEVGQVVDVGGKYGVAIRVVPDAFNMRDPAGKGLDLPPDPKGVVVVQWTHQAPPALFRRSEVKGLRMTLSLDEAFPAGGGEAIHNTALMSLRCPATASPTLAPVAVPAAPPRRRPFSVALRPWKARRD
jgi:hypothetical protein